MSAKKSGCSAILFHLFDPKSKPSTPEVEKLPYKLTGNFLSPAEISFYHVLRQASNDWAIICPKVSLGDLFYAKTNDRSADQTYRNKIDRKHIDFLLCDPKSMQPLLGIELDDASHNQLSRQERDHFVEQIFSTAHLPLLRQPVQNAYNVRDLSAVIKRQVGILVNEDSLPASEPNVSVETEDIIKHSDETVKKQDNTTPTSFPLLNEVPLCPQCGQPMVLRTVQKESPHKGDQFWGCQDFPRCRGVRKHNAS